MGECKLTLYEHPDYDGDHTYRTTEFTSTQPNGSDRINDRDSSGKVSGDCKNVSFLGFEDPNFGGMAWIMGEGDNIPNFHDNDSHGLGKGAGRAHRWYLRGDKVNAIQKIDIPTEDINAGRMRHDLTIYGKRWDERTNQWGHIPYILSASDANDTDQWLTGESDKGKPCPGGDGYWKGFQNVSCVYNNKEGLQNLHGSLTGPNDIRSTMFNTLINRYCDRAERLDERVGTNITCRNIVNAKAQAKAYCEAVPSRIATDKTFCTKTELGEDIFYQLAETYCKANPTDDFCACYNVMNYKQVCNANGGAAGCANAKISYDKYIELKQPEATALQSIKCKADLCSGSRFLPTGFNVGCNFQIQQCITSIETGTQNDTIQNQCNISMTNNTDTPPSQSQSGTNSPSSTPASTPSSTPASTPSSRSTLTPSSTPASTPPGPNDEPEFYKKTEFIIGTSSSISLLSIICFMLLFLL